MSKIRKGLDKIEDSIVGGYKKIEGGVVGGYKKIEDKFVDIFLKKDGETTEEAKLRINREQEELRKQQEELASKSKRYSKTTEEIKEEINKKYGLINNKKERKQKI